ncbi:hypothetical protein [Prevotella sp. KH2C16]|uniref:hypothetical protein n=1 Tax=Prevotella sp. KH2C16 TaxID=1855325 RepID=UPI0008EEB35B|nr:hypothetical protein [Prevotella sp. KH2C16]SFG29530.1 hypothetical protein SAMN05216383_10923 [Prevotella sp. KH2C16]
MNFKLSAITALLAVFALAACSSKKAEPTPTTANNLPERMKGDRTVYGLACEGCSDSVIVLLPEDGSDPIRYNCVQARRNHKVQGKMKIGDWIGIVPNADNSRIADFAVDLDDLKGIWCYVVMPKLKDADTMSRSAQAHAIAAMPDSVKKTYMIPREYGFYLKRQWVCQSLGYVGTQNSFEDESPVVYPPLSYFTGWRIWNGKLITISGVPVMGKDENGQSAITIKNERQDTCDIDYLMGDSLVLSSEGISRSYYRKNSLDEVNKKARTIAARLSEKAKKEAVK